MFAVGKTCEIRVRIRVMRFGRLGTIDGADRLAILPFDACHVQTHWGSARTVQPVQAHFFHGKSVTCSRQAVPLALSSFEWTPSGLPRLGLTGQAIPILIRRDTSRGGSGPTTSIRSAGGAFTNHRSNNVGIRLVQNLVSFLYSLFISLGVVGG
jgi:hypothetical protein